MNDYRHSHERGIALLITLLTMTVLLGVSASLLNITLKQYQFASIGLASEMSFQAANAGMECMLYHDYIDIDTTTPDSLESTFDIGQPNTSISCMGGSNVAPTVTTGSNTVRRSYSFDWNTSGSPALCTEVTIYKFSSAVAPAPDMAAALRKSTGDPGTTCPIGSTCTVIQSRGYNVACGQKGTPRVIERELTQRY